MFCTDKERNSCQSEKMGCDGCFYNKTDEELIVYISKLEKIIKDLEMQKNYYKKLYLECNNCFFQKGC